MYGVGVNNEGHQESLFLIFRAVLNVCFSYTARDEICSAMQELAQGVQDGLIRERYNPSKALDLQLFRCYVFSKVLLNKDQLT